MLLSQTICSVCIILVTEVIALSRGHPDCNHDKVVDQFFYLCNSYTGVKRDTNVADGFSPNNAAGFNPVQDRSRAPINWQQQQQLPGSPDGVLAPSPAQQQSSPTFQATSYYPWQIPSNSPSSITSGQQQDVQDHRIRRKTMQLPAALPNEPEDFASFNNWYLNPVYADADWQSAIERWRRRSHINDAIWKFVKQKCCKSGCPFPSEYWKLDKDVNICGMR